MKDWKGNSNSIYKSIGSSNHTENLRHKEDYYATEPKAVELLLDIETFNEKIWECACGGGHIAEVLKKKGYKVRASDLIDRGYGEVQDFLFFNSEKWEGDIITNPPYALAVEFIQKAMKLTFLEGQNRRNFFKQNPPKIVYISSSRLVCSKNGDFEKAKKELGGGAVAYAWFLWEKGYKGDPIVKWIN